MARQIREEGGEVAALVLIDSHAPRPGIFPTREADVRAAFEQGWTGPGEPGTGTPGRSTRDRQVGSSTSSARIAGPSTPTSHVPIRAG